MRSVPTDLAAHLTGGATTLATCWIVRRRDGGVFGFTDHDRSLTIDGVACEPASGFDRSTATRSSGFAVGEEEIAGALSSDAITEADLADGRWDGATVEIHRVNWAAPAERMRLRTATIGEVTRADAAFRAELRGPAFALEQPTGRVFGRGCDATLGDARCKVAGCVHDGGDGGGDRCRGTDRRVGRRRVCGALVRQGDADGDNGAAAGFTLAIEDHWIEGGTALLAPGAPRRCRWRPDGRVARRRLRQALRDLPREVRQHGELPRLSHMPGPRFRLLLCPRRGRRRRRRAVLMTRDDIISETLSWLGTPYRHQASLKGVGCDCLGLVRGVWRALVGPEPEPTPAYSPDWARPGRARACRPRPTGIWSGSG